MKNKKLRCKQKDKRKEERIIRGMKSKSIKKRRYKTKKEEKKEKESNKKVVQKKKRK